MTLEDALKHPVLSKVRDPKQEVLRLNFLVIIECLF